MLSDNFLVVMFGAGMVAVVLALLLMFQILLVRMTWHRGDAFDSAVEKKWGRILAMVLTGDKSEPLPQLAHRERLPFMRVWLHLHASLRGDSVDILNRVALKLGCDRTARQFLVGGDREKQIVGILVSGYLKDKGAWQSLVPLTSSANSTISMQAASAMLKIDGAVAIKQVMKMTLIRTDWSMADVAHMLQPNRELYIEAVLERLLSEKPRRMLRALRLLQALKAVLPMPIVQAILNQPSTDLKVAALRIATWSGLSDLVKAHAHDPEWPVRVAVANALRQIGTHEDLKTLEQLAGDRNWWVRYRAAGALSQLPSLTPSHLQMMAQSSHDLFTRDILQRVIAERDAQS